MRDKAQPFIDNAFDALRNAIQEHNKSGTVPLGIMRLAVSDLGNAIAFSRRRSQRKTLVQAILDAQCALELKDGARIDRALDFTARASKR